jgi:indole-3-glycerol phosphate synthase
MAHRRFSQAISEGDGISVIAAVEDASAARDAAAQRAEALVVTGDAEGVHDATSLPVLWRADIPLEEAARVADAYLLEYNSLEDDGDLEQLHRHALDLGLDCVVVVQNEEELEQALERVDPEILLLSPPDPSDHERAFACVLDLLPDVPAGKLAIADLPRTTPDDIRELERAGVDAVIVQARDIASLAGGPPPEV